MTDKLDRLKAALADRYTIESELGAGGMATVYLAHDIKHDRQVAVKVLRPELAVVLGADRFLNEIKVTANLQHPHILALYDSGEADSFLFYVMPYIEGESWQDKIDREHQLSVEEAVRLAAEVASALDYAHRHDVVHRDIKPANIMLADGGAQVADFGIALALKAAGGDRLTETGLSLGTPHYMSPEQAAGDRDVDHRSDIYSLGAVLYESLAGEPPHTGGTVQAVISKLITEDAKPIEEHRPSVPIHIALTLEKALARIPADRFATAAEFATALKDPSATADYATSSRRRAEAYKPKSGLNWRHALAGGLILLAGATVGRFTSSVESEHQLAARFTIPITWGSDVTRAVGLTGAPVNTIALSPDGKTIAFVGRRAGGRQRLFLRRINELTTELVSGTENAAFPVFSPDGERLLFLGLSNRLYHMSLDGGAPVAIPNVEAAPSSWAIWLDEETIAMTGVGGTLVRMTISGTLVDTIMVPDFSAGEKFVWAFSMVQGTNTLLTIITRGFGSANGPVVAIDLDDGQRTVVLPNPANTVFYSDGALVWARPDGVIQAAEFDPDRLEIVGPTVTLAENVRLNIGGGAQIDVSANGSMIYVPEQPFDLMLVDRDGRRETIAEGRRFHSPRFSPDGNTLAFDFIQQGNRDVYTLNLDQRTPQRLTFKLDGHDPVWTPDGRFIMFISGDGIFRRRTDGGGAADSIFLDALTSGVISFADDVRAVTSGLGIGGSWDVGVLDVFDENRRLEPLLATPFNEQHPVVSPDGRWLAYTSDETSRSEVYVRPFPEGGSKTIISQSGGSEPMWNPAGNELFYLGIDDGAPHLISASYDTRPNFEVTSHRKLFETSDFEPASPHANYDVSPDGSRFVFVYLGTIDQIVYVMNWVDEVHRANETD